MTDSDRYGSYELRKEAENGNSHAQKNLQQIKMLESEENDK